MTDSATQRSRTSPAGVTESTVVGLGRPGHAPTENRPPLVARFWSGVDGVPSTSKCTCRRVRNSRATAIVASGAAGVTSRHFFFIAFLVSVISPRNSKPVTVG